MKPQLVILSALCLFFFFSGCKNDDNTKLVSGPEIEWISGGTTTTYSYSGGVISGYNFHRSFKVVNESGEVTIKVQVLDDDNSAVSATFTVEEGTEYALTVHASKSGSQSSNPGSKCLTVVFSSPNSLSDQEIKVDSYLVSSAGMDLYYCPKTLSFGEIGLSE